MRSIAAILLLMTTACGAQTTVTTTAVEPKNTRVKALPASKVEIPEVDIDKDGILGADDKCPEDPEDIDDFEDEDGCPDLDNDRDGIADLEDKCPLAPENYNGYIDDDGCPDAVCRLPVSPSIVIVEKIYFPLWTGAIQPQSMPIIDEIAEVMLANPHIDWIQVEGHGAVQGRKKQQIALSKARAEAVRDALVKRGLAPERIRVKWFGSDNPVTLGTAREDHRRNARVGFTVAQPEP